MKRGLVPELRFPEFSGEWKQERIKKIFDIIVGGDVPKNGFNEQKTEKYCVPIYSNSLGENGLYGYTDKPRVFENESLTIAGRGVNIGEVIYRSEPYYPIIRLLCCTLKDNNMFIKFFEHVFKNIKITPESTGVPQLTSPKFGSYFVRFPTSIEQNKISCFFSKIDEKIEKQKEKVTNLEEYKNGMIQKIFSKEIRFTDKNGEDYPEWKEKKLGEVAEAKTGNSNVQDAVENGKYNFFDRSIIIKKLNTFDYDEEAIIYPGEGSSFYPQYYKGKYGLHQRAYSITSSRINMKYLNYMLMLRNNHFLKTAVGSTVKSLRMDNFLECLVYVPIEEEQIKIANFLSSIDYKIKKETEKLESIKELKKGLMQNMFI